MRRKNNSSAQPEQSRLSSHIVARAASWASRLTDKDELSAAERAHFQEWLRTDPSYAAELQVQTAIRELAREVPGNVRARWVADVRAYERRRFRWSRSWGGSALTASAIVAALIAVLSIAEWRASTAPSLYVTRTAEMRTIRFTDGSTATLNTRTRLQWVPMSHERRIVLQEGEAFFQVAHDTLRPFSVVVDHTVIQDVGTDFDVFRKPDGRVRVIVLEGAVKIAGHGPNGAQPGWQRLVKAHQQIDYRGAGIPGDVRRAVDEDLEWRRGTVRFHRAPLSEVVEELQRYTDQPILIADPDLAQAAVGGVYSIRSIPADLAHIAQLVPMTVQERNGTITLEHVQPEPRRAH